MFTFIVSITKLKFVFLVTQVCQSTAWCFEWRPKNSALIQSLKRPLAGTPTGSVVTPSPWERRPVLLSVSRPTWKTRSSSFIDSSWDLASAGATIWVVSSIWTKRHAVWAAGHQNLGVYREQNSPSVVLWSGCLQNEDRRLKTKDRRPKNEDPNFFARIRHGQLKN